MIIKAGETLLYRACDLNDVIIVRRLLDKGLGFNPPVEPSIWCRQDSQMNTILHRAVQKKYDITVIDAISKADPSVCTVKNSSDRFPVEVILHAKESYFGDGGKFLYGELPNALISTLFENMKPVDLAMVIEAYCRDPSHPLQYQQHQQRFKDFQVLASSLQPVRAVRSINVHLLGYGFAGKSTLRAAFRDTLPNPSKVMGAINSFLGYNRDIEIKDRTIGCEVETIVYNDRYWRFFDYGGQEMFHANHDRYLKLPASLYIIVVPLCDYADPRRPCWSETVILRKYKYWLRFLASIFEDDTVVEVFTVLNGKRQANVQFIEDIRKVIQSEQKKWEKAGQALSKDQQEPLLADVKPRLRFVNVNIPCIDNNRLNDVRNEMNDVMAETIARVQREAVLYPKLLAKFDDVKKVKPPPVFLSVTDFKDLWLVKAIDEVEASPKLIEYLKEWMLQRLQTLKEIIVVKKEFVLTNCNWLSSNMLGEIIVCNEKSEIQKSLLTTQDVLDLIKKDTSNDQLQALQSIMDPNSLEELLESVGACVRVNTPSKNETSAPKLFFPMMKTLVIAAIDLQPIKLDSYPDYVSHHVIKRRFKLVDSEFFTFPPGYFERLFAEIVFLDTRENEQQGIRIEAYENALRVQSGKSIIIQTIVTIEGDEFNVTVSTLLNRSDYSEEMRKRGSCAKDRLTSICDRIHTKPKPEVKMYCSHPTDTVSKPLEAVEPYLEYKENQQLFDGVIYLKAGELETEKRFHALRRAINEIVEVKVPYCFFLTSEKLGKSIDNRQQQPSSDGSSYLSYLKEFMQNPWQTFSVNSKASDPLPPEPSELWFYLLDQFTMTPIVLPVDDPNTNLYPIKITKPNEFIQKCYPVLTYALSLLKGVNDIGAIARLMGYPVSDLRDVLEAADRYVGDNSHAHTSTVLAGCEEENASKTFMRGFRLKDLAVFYAENRCKEIASICKLYPVIDKDGYRVWTAEKNKKSLFQKADVGDSGSKANTTSSESFSERVGRNDGDNSSNVATPANDSLFQKANVNINGSSGNTANPANKDIKFECYIWEQVSIPIDHNFFFSLNVLILYQKYGSLPGEWSEEKEHFKLEDGRCMHFEISTTITAFYLTSCKSLVPLKDTKRGISGRPTLPFQLVLQGYEPYNQLIIGFETEEEMETRKNAILPHIQVFKV